jgi:hypothetical protein
LGVLKLPVKGVAVTVVLPGATPVKVVVMLAVPPVKASNEVETVPTLVKVLVTLTLAESPPAKGCNSTKLPDASSKADEIVNVVREPGLVVKLWPVFGPDITKPEGPSVIVPEPIRPVVVVAVTVTVPVPVVATACAQTLAVVSPWSTEVTNGLVPAAPELALNTSLVGSLLVSVML